jgi:hypothetical protein
MAKSKVELILQMRDRMTAALRRAKNAVSTETRQISTSFQKCKSRVGAALAFLENRAAQFRSRLLQNFQALKTEIPILGRAIEVLKNPFVLVAAGAAGAVMGVRRLISAAGQWIEDSNAQNVAAAKLNQVMNTTMNATPQQVKNMLELASAQQKVGVIGDEVQVAGMQQLALSLKQADSLKKLTPVMNDYIAQTYGLNATQEQAVAAAGLFQKAMNGQTGMLSRQGIAISEAQDKIFKYGTEAQKVAALSELMSSKFGGMNEALAATPEGKMQQIKNSLSDIREDAGGVALDLKGAFFPFFEFLQRGLIRLVTWFKEHSNQIKTVVSNVMSVVMGIIRGIYSAISFIWSIKEVILGIAAAWGVWQVALGVMHAKTLIMTIAQWALNVAMNANPIGIIILAVGILIGVIMMLRNKYEGWGTLFKAVGVTIVSYLKQLLATWKFIFQEMWYSVQLVWLRIKNFAEYIGALFTNIGKAMKEALSGNFSEARDILKQKITTDAEVEIKKVEKERADNRKQFADESFARAKEVADAWKAVKITKKVKEEKTTPVAGMPTFGGGALTDNTGGGGGGGGDSDSDSSSSADKVAGSATQVRNITVNINRMGADNINVNSETYNAMSPSQMDDYFNDLLLRAIRNIEMSY